LALYQLFGFKSSTNLAVAVGHVHNRERGLLILVCWLPIIADLCGNCKLEVGSQAQGDTAGRADGIAREESAEIDDVKNVVKVLSVDLEAHCQVVGFINLRTR
jgi:hypothetical protein